MEGLKPSARLIALTLLISSLGKVNSDVPASIFLGNSEIKTSGGCFGTLAKPQPEKFIVRLKPSKDNADTFGLSKVFGRVGNINLAPSDPQSPLNKYYVLTSGNNLKDFEIVQSLRPVLRLSLPCVTAEAPVTLTSSNVPVAAPRNEFFNLQWPLYNSGQIVAGKGPDMGRLEIKGTAGADINIFSKNGEKSIYNLYPPSRDVVIAIADTGIQYSHPDLQGRFWPFGHYDAIENRLLTLAESKDPFGHGTHVACIVACDGKVMGIASDAKFRLLNLRVLGETGATEEDILARGIRYATVFSRENNLPLVLNLSLGGGWPSDLIRDAIHDARKEGVIVVASAGNTGSEGDIQPGVYADLAVGGTDNRDLPVWFTSYGQHVKIAAPAWGVFAAVSPNSYLANRYREYLIWSGNNPYLFLDGNSMSTPMISAVAARVLSQNGMNAQKTVGILESTANFSVASNLIPPKRNKYIGSGRVDAMRALQNANNELLRVYIPLGKR